jgi:hypothetical protein
MDTKITVIYDHPVDPDAFEAGYPEQLKLAHEMQGAQRVESAKVWPKEDGSPTPACRLLDMYSVDYDVGQLLHVLESVIARRPANAAAVRSDGIVTDCLQRLGVDHATAMRLERRRLRNLYASRGLPIRLTLGAAVALDAAQRGEWFGFPDEEVLANAVRVSSRLPDLISDRILLRLATPATTGRTSH